MSQRPLKQALVPPPRQHHPDPTGALRAPSVPPGCCEGHRRGDTHAHVHTPTPTGNRPCPAPLAKSRPAGRPRTDTRGPISIPAARGELGCSRRLKQRGENPRCEEKRRDQAEPDETRLHHRGRQEGAEGDGIARLQNTMHRSLILIPGRGLAGGRVCLLKLARPSVIILLHQKGPGPALSKERPRSLTSPPPAEGPVSGGRDLRGPPRRHRCSGAPLPGSPPPGRAARGSRFPHRARGMVSREAGAPSASAGGRRRGGEAAPRRVPGPCPHGLLPRPVPNPPPSRLRYPVPRPSLGLARSGKRGFCRERIGNRLSAPAGGI